VTHLGLGYRPALMLLAGRQRRGRARSPTLLFGDQQPVSGVELLASREVCVALVPTAGVQVRGEPVEAPARLAASRSAGA
jgi:hypothetical protein